VKYIVLETEKQQQKWLQTHTVWTQTGYTNKHCSVKLNGGET